MQRMRLRRFRVTGFRSIVDSGWIDVDTVGGLIGTNESGKTNVLVPLWKLRPAKGGELNPTADYPRKRFHEIRAMEKKPVFVSAIFELDDRLAAEVAKIAGVTPSDVRVAAVTRDFDGGYTVSFPEANVPRTVPAEDVRKMLGEAKAAIEGMKALKTEESQAREIIAAMETALADFEDGGDEVTANALQEARQLLSRPAETEGPKTSTIAPTYRRLLGGFDGLIQRLAKPPPSSNDEARKVVVDHMPSFVYYSNYGNLDSEIYLPHVIENMTREGLGVREEAKRRTLKVLFDFVKLDPEEVLKLGQETPPGTRPTDDQIQEIAERKKQRTILLQSAGTDLTQKFRDWWKQGEYRFRFEADGNHFRIWVSDDLRPEEIELEGRSSGLQWFLSFFLVFLVESEDSHEGAILLLDEPGLTLHPLAQEDLSAFFDNLSKTNQIVYTTHSPFMVHADHLDRVKAVYVGDDGSTRVSSDLRSSDARSSQGRSIFAVHAALGLTASKTLLQFCRSIIVEGHSDQTYLTAMKTHLIAHGLIRPPREMVFLPAWGTKGIKAVIPIIAGADEALPFVIHDSDEAGTTMAESLRNGLYNADPSKLVAIGDFVSIKDAEIEDLWPPEFMADVITRTLRGPEEDFSDALRAGEPIVPQVEAYAERHGIVLEKPGWKVGVAERAKARLLREPALISPDSEYAEAWVRLFKKLWSD